MKIKNFLIISTLFMVLLCGVSAISAASDNTVNNLTSEIDSGVDSISVSNDEKAIGVDEKNSALNAQENDEEINGQSHSTDNLQNELQELDIAPLNDELNQLNFEETENADFQGNKLQSGDNYHSIYVGKNTTSDGGNGSKENPYNNLTLVQSNYGESTEKVVINIYNGTYFLSPGLTFKTSELSVNSVNGEVILKNLNNDANSKQAFILTTEGVNFTMSGITFDYSGYTQTITRNQCFSPFIGMGYSNVIYNNCTFTGISGKHYITEYNDQNNNIIFESCKFINSNCVYLFYSQNSNMTFRYCIFLANFTSSGISGAAKENSLIFDSNWFGQNNITFHYFYKIDPSTNQPRPRYNNFDSKFSFTRYAVLDVYENYLGENKYEIIGKLMWNDSTVDNIDKLGPMIVYLSADNGNIPNIVTLENGTFNVTYISDSDYHEITAVLDYQTIKLNNNINFTLNSPIITYGEDQNITVTFPNNVKGTVYVTVNNKTCPPKYCDDKNNVTVSIDDKLPKGNYDVSVKFVSDNEQDVISFGFNSTTISVLGISSSLTTSPVTTTYNITKELVATLSDVNGNVLDNKQVHIVVGTIDKTLNTTSDGKVSVDVSGLVPGSYVATISFDGDDCYYGNDTSAVVVVNKVVPDVIISREGDLVPGEKLIVKVEVPYATENVTIIVNGDKNTTKLVDNVATYAIDELTQGTYYVTVLYAGDELCDFAYATNFFNVVKSTVDLINDLNNTIESQKELIGNLSDTIVAQNSTLESQKVQIGNLTNLVVAQNATIIAQKEQIDNLKKTNGEVVVSKKATKLTAPKKTFKAKTKTKKLKVKLTTGKTVLKNKKVTLKVKGKTYTAKTNKKGIATFKITKLTKKGTFKYTVKFAGDKAYKTTNKKGKIIVK